MNQKKFIESQGATCKNWYWSWSFVNHARRIVIFGAVDRNIVGKKTIILSEDWRKNRRGEKPAFGQSLEHIRLIEEEGYQLMTFPKFWKDSKAGRSKIERFIPKLTKKKLRKAGGDWFALNYYDAARTQTAKGGKITKLLAKRRKFTTTPTKKRVGNGAGFGSAERNRVVEQAACKLLKKYFNRLGYEVVSREKENLGYDFDVTKNGETIHVEVKGVSGSMLKFPITANEIACARTDSKFRLAVVVEATTPKRKIYIFTRKEFLSGFGLTPLAYFAEAKKSLHA